MKDIDPDAEYFMAWLNTPTPTQSSSGPAAPRALVPLSAIKKRYKSALTPTSLKQQRSQLQDALANSTRSTSFQPK